MQLPTKESQTVEFKQSFNIEVIETLVAFANAKGGTIYIGVTDQKKIIGVELGKESISRWLNEIKSKTEATIIPTIEVSSIENKNVVLMSIAEYPIKPLSVQGRYFKRIQNSNHRLTVEEIANEHLKTINMSWDYYIDPNHSQKHISVEKVQNFMHRIELRNERKIILSPEKFLERMEFVRDGNLPLEHI